MATDGTHDQELKLKIEKVPDGYFVNLGFSGGDTLILELRKEPTQYEEAMGQLEHYGVALIGDKEYETPEEINDYFDNLGKE